MFLSLAALAVIPLASALPSGYSAPDNASTPTKSSVEWKKCTMNSEEPKTTDPVQMWCGKLKVPLDYTDKGSKDTLELSIYKAEAVYQDKKKGSILINFGGPGVGGKGLPGVATDFLKLSGGVYDLITWDPRGTEQTLPFACFNSSSRMLAMEESVKIPANINISDTAPGQAFAAAKTFGKECERVQGKLGSLIGTAFTARDAMQIVDAVEKDKMLRFFGMSYGTYLGQTLAAMFPDRIDRMVLDGVVNPFQYRDNNEMSDAAGADATLTKFASDCASRPEVCPLAFGNKSTATIEADIWKTVEQIRVLPLIMDHHVRNYDNIKSMLRDWLMKPAKWTALSGVIASYATRNITRVIEWELKADGKDFELPEVDEELPKLPADMDSLEGIRCSDTAVREADFLKVLPETEKRLRASRVSGEGMERSTYKCLQWPYKAKEIYNGKFDEKTKNPILFIGSPHDAATSYQSAEVAHAAWKGSALIKHDAPGHCFTGSPASACTAKAFRAYMVDGTLPKELLTCSSEFHTFSDSLGWEETYKGLGWTEGDKPGEEGDDKDDDKDFVIEDDILSDDYDEIEIEITIEE